MVNFFGFKTLKLIQTGLKFKLILFKPVLKVNKLNFIFLKQAFEGIENCFGDTLGKKLCQVCPDTCFSYLSRTYLVLISYLFEI